MPKYMVHKDVIRRIVGDDVPPQAIGSPKPGRKRRVYNGRQEGHMRKHARSPRPPRLFEWEVISPDKAFQAAVKQKRSKF